MFRRQTFVDAIEAGHRALNAIVQGNPELKNRMFSHREDVCWLTMISDPGAVKIRKALCRANAIFESGMT